MSIDPHKAGSASDAMMGLGEHKGMQGIQCMSRKVK